MQEIERDKVKKEISNIKKQITSAKKDIETLELNIPAALRGEIPLSVDKLSEMVKDKEDAIAKLEVSMKEKLEELEKMKVNQKDISSIGSIVANWGELFMESSIPEKKVMLARLIERIEILDDDIRIKFKIRFEDYVENLPRISDGSPTPKSIAIRGNGKPSNQEELEILPRISTDHAVQKQRI